MTPAVRQILFDGWRRGAGLWLDFANDRYFQQGVGSGIGLVSVSRASIGTDLLPSSPADASYSTFAANTPRRSALAGGLLVEGGRTQLSAFPTAPQNETITIGSTGTYTLWVNGSGSATVAAGTAVGSGFGAATNGTPVVFAISSTGTVGITVTGSLQALQVELGTWGSSFIPQAATVRALDRVTLRNSLQMRDSITLFSDSINYGTNTSMSLWVSDGSGSNRAGFFRDIYINANITVGGVDTVIQGPTISGGVRARSAYAIAGGQQSLTANGSIAVTSSGAWTIGPQMTVVDIGGLLGIPNFQQNGVIYQVAIWPSDALSDSDLQRMTIL